MTAWNPRLWRVARRIEAEYAAARRAEHHASLPESSWRDLKIAQHRCRLAEERDWSIAAQRERATLCDELERLASQLTERVRVLRKDPPPPPSARLLYEELSAVAAEFGELEIEDDSLGITTEPITLEEIGLGPFTIRLDLRRLGDEAPYRIVALEPNPAASSSETTHPHVNGERLCAGDGRSAIGAALAEGRLFDFFTLVDRVLHTYGEGSAYVELDRWYGVPCHDCNATVDDDERYTCESCEETLCGDCTGSCESCSSCYCNSCLDCCELCETSHCRGCLTSCGRCRRSVCESCRDGRFCETCLEELQDETEEEDETPSDESPVPESPVHADGLGEASSPA